MRGRTDCNLSGPHPAAPLDRSSYEIAACVACHEHGTTTGSVSQPEPLPDIATRGVRDVVLTGCGPAGQFVALLGPIGLSAPVAVPSEVGVAGVGAVLESVVQRAVHADVGHPDQGDGEDARLVLPNTYPSECRGQRCGVRQVVEVCTDTRASEVAQGSHVRQ